MRISSQDGCWSFEVGSTRADLARDDGLVAIVDLGLSLLVDETSAAGMATAVDGELLASLLDIANLRYFFYEPDSFFDVALDYGKRVSPWIAV